jgi:GTP-binding protein EngB required for normal cell division
MFRRYDGAPIIAFMGVAGSGKSHLIGTLTGDITIGGNRLRTQEVKAYGVTINGKKVILLDTPGLNNTNHSDSVILLQIADWIATLYKMKIRLSGIVYMHDISVRMTDSSLTSLKLFRELCGDDFYKNVVFVTNMWHVTPEELGNQRLQELKENDSFWRLMINRGATAVDYRGDMTTERIVSMIMEKVPGHPQLGIELIDEGKALIDTGAGRVADEALAELRGYHLQELASIKLEMKIAMEEKDKDMEEQLRTQEAETQMKIDRVEREVAELRAEVTSNFQHSVKFVGIAFAGALTRA